MYASLISFELQELLDLKQRQQRGPQLVQQIRKQANDVSIQICWFTFVLFFYIASCIWYIAQHTKTLSLPSLHMTGPWFYHINALQNTENWRFCRTTWVRRSETQGQSTGGRLMTFIDILHLLKIVGDALHELALKTRIIFFSCAWIWTEWHLQSERAARKATVLQMATMYTALGGTLLNVGVTLNSQGNQIVANGSFIGAGRCFLHLLTI